MGEEGEVGEDVMIIKDCVIRERSDVRGKDLMKNLKRLLGELGEAAQQDPPPLSFASQE